MSGTLAHVTLVTCLSSVWGVTIGAASCDGQTPVTSLDALRHELAIGDAITVVAADGQPVTGRLVRFDDVEVEVRAAREHTARERVSPDVTIPLSAVLSIERRPDAARNGAGIGAAVGAGVGGALFVHAMVVDRNEIDEWAPFYIGAAAICTGLGALIGWAVDAAHSKPHVRFEASSARRTTVSVQPRYSGRGAISLAVSISR